GLHRSTYSGASPRGLASFLSRAESTLRLPDAQLSDGCRNFFSATGVRSAWRRASSRSVASRHHSTTVAKSPLESGQVHSSMIRHELPSAEQPSSRTAIARPNRFDHLQTPVLTCPPVPTGPDETSRAVLGVIPARYGASRFPGKPLAMLWGKPMLQ